jgi:hypothetical protein
MVVVMKAPSFSYSSLSMFITCPKQYSAHKVEKYIERTDTEATIYGTELHTAAELYIRDGAPIPAKFGYVKPYLDRLNAIVGAKYCELELGIKIVDGEYVHCGFEDEGRYWRGIADLVIVDGDRAFIVDYKSGRSSKYADVKQLALLAAAVFLAFPDVKTIKGMLLFVVCRDIIKEDYTYADRFEIFNKLKEVLTHRGIAYETGVFNAKPNGLCRDYCMAVKCVHNGRYDGDK